MGCTQISVNGILKVPEHKPDIESILRISARVIIDNTCTMRKKIFFAGHVDICVEYVACACDSTQPIHLLHTEIPFKGLRLHRCAREGLKTFLKTKIRFCEIDIINTRKINSIVIFHLGKVKFRRIAKHPDPQCLKPFHENVCKSANSHCEPIEKPSCDKPDCCDNKKPCGDHDCKAHHSEECKPPSHNPSCKPHESCDCMNTSEDHDCKSHDSCHDKKPSYNHDCKPHSHNSDCVPHYSGYCKPPTYDDYTCKSNSSGDCKPYEYVSSDDFHVPTYIQPCQKMGNRHGVAFGFNYEE